VAVLFSGCATGLVVEADSTGAGLGDELAAGAKVDSFEAEADDEEAAEVEVTDDEGEGEAVEVAFGLELFGD